MDNAALIAIDWGTTAARAYRLAQDGRVLAERRAPLGIQQVKEGAFSLALATLLADWPDAEGVPCIACGMIGSRQGWIEAPYRACPAALDTLATGIIATPRSELQIVPGVSCRDATGVPDVMRGEETQILGAVANGSPNDESARRLIVLPGTHCKWAVVANGAIETFATFLTGELFAVLREHSILGRTMGARSGIEEREAAAFARGVRGGLDTAASDASLLHDLFGVRTLALFGELTAGASSEYLSGMLIGTELRAGIAWAARHHVDAAAATLIGAPALGARYLAAFAEAGMNATAAPADAAARGLWVIAHRAGLVSS